MNTKHAAEPLPQKPGRTGPVGSSDARHSAGWAFSDRVFMALPTATAVIAQSGIIVDVNTAWRRLTGDDAGTDVGDPLWRRFAPAERAHIVALIERLRDTPGIPEATTPTVTGTQIRHVDGRRINVALRVAAAHDRGTLLVAQLEPLAGTQPTGAAHRPGAGDRQVALVAIAKAISTGTDADRTAQSVLPFIARAMGCPVVGLWRRASRHEPFVLVDGLGFSANAPGAMVLEGHDGGLAGHTIRSRSVVVIGGPTGTSAKLPRALTELGVSSGAAVPLYGIAGADGLLLVSVTHNQPIDADDIRFLSIVGDLLSVALQRGGVDELIASERQRTAAAAQDLDRTRRQHQLACDIADLTNWCWVNPAPVTAGARSEPPPRWSLRQCLEAGPQALVDCAVDDDADAVVRTVNAALANGGTFRLKVRLQTSEGVVPLRLQGYVEADDARRVWGVAATDPTRAPAQDANAPLAPTMHELNNLLTAVLGTAEHLVEQGTHRQQMSAVVHACRRARQLVAGLRSDHDRQHPLAGPYELADVVEQQRPLLQGLVGSDVHLIFDLKRGSRTSRLAREQVECILLDLVANSADALRNAGEGERPGGRGPGATVLIATDAHVVLGRAQGAPPSGAWARLRVRDNGTGMTASDRDRAFATGYTTKATGDHSGIGLATVRAAVAAAGGVIGIHSEPNRGTTIDIYLPLATQEATRLHPLRPALPSSTAAAPAAASRVALIADDEPALRGLLRELLCRLGFEVTVADDGVSALARARSLERVDVVVSDLRMPRMNGLDLGRRVRDIHPGARIVLLTGAPEPPLVADHDVMIVRKPFEWSDLRDAVLTDPQRPADASPRAASG